MSKSVANAWLVLLARVPALLSQFRTNRAGNTAIIFALSAIPVVAAIGCVTDYSYATMVKTKLQAASDAAALATVSNNSPIVATAKSMSGNGTVAGGPTYIQNFFSADTTAFTGVSATGSTTKSGTTVTATLSYSYNVPTTFMKVLGYPSMALTGSSTASVTVATYIDFYLMLDVSGSMSFPSTAAEQVRLMSVNPDNLIRRLSARLPVRLPLGDAEHRLHANRAGKMAPGPAELLWREIPDYQRMAERLSRRLLHGVFDKPSRNYAGLSDELRSQQ